MYLGVVFFSYYNTAFGPTHSHRIHPILQKILTWVKIEWWKGRIKAQFQVLSLALT